MSEITHLLRNDGTVSQPDQQSLELLTRIDGELDPSDLGTVSLSEDTVMVVFNGVADGRGFSQAKALRDIGYTGKIYAGGYINPDQLSSAFQAGFDGVLVTEQRWQDYGEDSWQAALSPAVGLSYIKTHSNQLDSIWQARHNRL